MTVLSVAENTMPAATEPDDAAPPILIGRLLLEKGAVTKPELERALSVQREIGGRLGAILIRIGALSEDVLLSALSQQLGRPTLSPEQFPEDYQAVAKFLDNTGLIGDWWIDQEVLAWEAANGRVCCTAHDPLNSGTAEILEHCFGAEKLVWHLSRGHDLEHALATLAAQRRIAHQDHSSAEQLRELADEAPVIEFVNNMIAQAFDQGASDIHIEPEEHVIQIRSRIDGVLHTRFTLPISRYRAIASRIKLVSGMDIAEQRLPQDGHLDTRVSGEALDIRVSSLPGVHGESIVMRLLPKEKQRFDLETLGLAPDNLSKLRQWAHEPHGIILVTGPTGSGKSTTLYSLLDSINDGQRKIITVEDPVEYRLPGITQVQTQEDIEYTFARALRSILRQDPDVIMIGEIRDSETAEIAIQSSLTGHLVLSTLHTNDAVSAFTRLIDMGVEPFLVATPVRAVMAQRLVRRLCQHCAVDAPAPVDDILEIIGRLKPSGKDWVPLWRESTGCEHCQGSGFSGRIGIHELVPVTPEIQHSIVNGATTTELRELASQQRVINLREDGFLKAAQGVTTIAEVLRVTAN